MFIINTRPDELFPEGYSSRTKALPEKSLRNGTLSGLGLKHRPLRLSTDVILVCAYAKSFSFRCNCCPGPNPEVRGMRITADSAPPCRERGGEGGRGGGVRARERERERERERKKERKREREREKERGRERERWREREREEERSCPPLPGWGRGLGRLRRLGPPWRQLRGKCMVS